MILAILNLLVFAQAGVPALPQSAPTPSITQPATERVVYEISRLRNYDDERVPAALITAAVIALVAVVWYLYRRDTVELARLPRFGIVLLRLIAIAGLLVFFLGIERRTTREVVHNSQVAVLVDVSQSMGLGEHENSAETGGTRIQAVIDALANGPLVSELRQSHDVNVARFERDVEPVISMPKSQEPGDKSQEPDTKPSGGKQAPALDSKLSTLDSFDWSTALQPRGTETRLGQALADELRLYHNAPLAGIDYQMHDAKDMALNAQQLAGFQMGDALLVALIAILLLEQLLAYLASYHVRPARSTTR
jgi:hypothetical protein